MVVEYGLGEGSYMDDGSRLPLRRLIVVFIVLVALVWGLIWLIGYMTTGYLTVTTSNFSDTVSIKPLNSPAGGSQVKSAKHSITARLKPGQYVISASSHTLSSSKVVAVKARQNSKYRLDPPKASPLESVLPASPLGLAAGPTSLVYVDSFSGNVMRVGASGPARKLSGISVRQASLVSPSLGVVQDEQGRLYRVNNGSVAPLGTSGHTPDSFQSNISLSKSGLLAFTSKGKVYSGKLGSAYKPIHSSNSTTKVYCGGNKVAIVEKVDPEAEAEGENEVTVIDSSGHKVSKEMDALHAAWSPSGKYLFIAAEEGNYVYDSSLELVAALDPAPVSSFAWIDNHSLAYATGRYLSLYDPKNNRSGQIAKTQSDINLVSAASDSSYIYIGTESAGEVASSTVMRVGLKGQSIPDYLQTLGIFLPANIGVCSIGYVNFSKPTILAYYPPATTTPDFCINAGKGLLIDYGVDPGKFRYSAMPSVDR